MNRTLLRSVGPRSVGLLLSACLVCCGAAMAQAENEGENLTPTEEPPATVQRGLSNDQQNLAEDPAIAAPAALADDEPDLSDEPATTAHRDLSDDELSFSSGSAAPVQVDSAKAESNFASGLAPRLKQGDAQDELSFLGAISSIESEQGAYSAQLPEQMLSLGLSLQRQQRYTEAVKVFKRGVHLARINNGLYSAEQIPLLRGQVNSLIAMGEYEQADERQHYLYKVQLRSLGSGGQRAVALMQQANWQYNAYRLGLGWQGFGRLSNMWELYRAALNEIINTEGESSPKLLPPLEGMLRTQYLISAFEGETGEADLNFGSSYGNTQNPNHFYYLRSKAYERGRSIIAAIYNIHKEQHGGDSVEATGALVMLGDWAQWNDKREESNEVYRQVIAELAALDDAQLVSGRFFAEPVPLPDMDGIRPLPPAVSTEQGDILLEFGVNPRGRVVDLVRQDEDGERDGQAIRLMRELRKTRFRPRFEAGEPVGTEKLVRAYDINK
jgi:hypothetical protein